MILFAECHSGWLGKPIEGDLMELEKTRQVNVISLHC